MSCCSMSRGLHSYGCTDGVSLCHISDVSIATAVQMACLCVVSQMSSQLQLPFCRQDDADTI